MINGNHTTIFLGVVLFLTTALLGYNELHAQSDIIQIRSDKVISAEASNLFPKVNEPVNIKIAFKSPMSAKHGEFALLYVWDEDIELISGNQGFPGDLTEGQIIEMTVTVKFPHKKVYSINLALNSAGKNRLAGFSFYVDGAFRESNEVIIIRDEIARQRKMLERDKAAGEKYSRAYPGLKFVDTVKNSHNLNPANDYERKNIDLIIQKNKELYKMLKKEVDSLWNEQYKLFINKRGFIKR